MTGPRPADDAGASEINRLYPESRRKVEKERPISEFTLRRGGYRKRAADEDENWSDVTRGEKGRTQGRKGLTAPKRDRGAPKRSGKENAAFFAAGMKRKESARRNLQTLQQVERSWSQL
ncbi:hypothetical protein TNCV_3231201 [Trichonephila clavipes]|nr:hypothetical protein TNCV_3231201 [Trichonephila clavipes]